MYVPHFTLEKVQKKIPPRHVYVSVFFSCLNQIGKITFKIIFKAHPGSSGLCFFFCCLMTAFMCITPSFWWIVWHQQNKVKSIFIQNRYIIKKFKM